MGDIKLYKNGFYTSMEIPKGDRIHTAFFKGHFERRDVRRGFPYAYSRFENLDDALKVTFSHRELYEIIFDKYTDDEFFPYFRYLVTNDDEAKKCLDDIEKSQMFFEFGYVLRASSGNDRWDYFKVAVPGRSDEEVKKMFYSKFHSSSKHNIHFMGFSPLLKLSATNFLSYMSRMPPKMKLSEQKYLMGKLAKSKLSETSGDEYVSSLLKLKIDNLDKAYFRMLKRWSKPLILFDNCYLHDNFQKIDFDEFNANYDMLKFFYPIFRDVEHPLPDIKFENGEVSIMNNAETMYDPRSKPHVFARILTENKKPSSPEEAKYLARSLSQMKESQKNFEADMNFDDF